MRKITLNEIKELGACREAVEFFRETFGEETPVTVKLCVKYANKLDWSWAAYHILKGASLTKYRDEISSAWKTYDSIAKSAKEVYDKALEDYNQGEIIEEQWILHHKMYSNIMDMIWDASNATRAATFAKAWNFKDI